MIKFTKLKNSLMAAGLMAIVASSAVAQNKASLNLMKNEIAKPVSSINKKNNDLTRMAVQQRIATGNSGASETTNNILLSESFETGGADWTYIDANADGYDLFAGTSSTLSRTGTGVLVYSYNDVDATIGADDWAISPAMSFEAGEKYEITLYYRARSADFPESMQLFLGNGNTVSDMTTQIGDLPTIANITYQQFTYVYDATSTENFHLGIYCNSAADNWLLLIDDIEVRQLANVDAGVLSITNPSTACCLSNSEQITISVRNFGATDITDLEVSYSINGGAAITETIASISATSTISHTFATTADLSTYGEYSIVAYTSLTNDSNLDNDTITKVVESLEPIADLTIKEFRMNEYTAVPLEQAKEIVINASVKNNGTAAANNVVLNYEIADFGGNVISTGASSPISVMNPNDSADIQINTGYTYADPNINILTTTVIVSSDDDDDDETDNISSQRVYMSDTTYARDQTYLTGTADFVIGLTGTDNNVLWGMIFELFEDDTLTSVGSFIGTAGTGYAAANDTTRFVIYDYDDVDMVPNAEIARSQRYTFATNVTGARAIAANIQGGPIALPAGKYFVGIQEIPGARRLGVFFADSLYTEGQTIYRANDGTWVDMGDINLAGAFVIRPQFGVPCGRMSGNAVATASDTNTTNTGAVSITVTGGSLHDGATYAYSWLNAGGDEVGTTSSVSGLPAGTYTVTVTDGIGCEHTRSVTVNSVTVGIGKLAKANGVSVYPNPASNVINISASDIKATNISLINSVGQEVFSTSNANASINVADFAEGSYIVKIRTENNVIIEKVNIVR
jgi:hypothetical protein